MIRRVLFPAVLLSLLIACGNSTKQTVVVVNVERVAKESVRAHKAIKEVEDFASSVEGKLNEALQQIQAASADPRSNPADVALMKQQWTQMRQQAEQQVDERRSKAEAEIHRMLDETIGALAKEKGWDLVVRKGQHAAIWSSEALDQTDLVIQRLDASAQAPAAEKSSL